MIEKKRGFEVIKNYDSLGYMPRKDVKLPQRGTSKSAGYDFYLPCSIILDPNVQILIETQIKAYMQDDEVLKIYPRSSLGFKYYCRLANTTGIIDAKKN